MIPVDPPFLEVIPYARNEMQDAMGNRVAEITALQAWAKELRQQIEDRFHEHGLGDQFLGEHFRGWAQHYGVYR